jgi:hypothetical protein
MIRARDDQEAGGAFLTSLTRRLYLRAFWVVLVPCAVLAGGFLFSTTPATASEVEPPTIASAEVTDVTEASVTLVAQINPHDSEGEYQFRLVWQASPPAFRGEPIPGGPQVHQGLLAGGAGEQTVSAVMAGLQPGHLYWYVVVATNSEQRTKAGPTYFSFHYSGGFPEGIGGAPYEAEGPPEWFIDLSEEESAQTVREYEAKQRQAAKEREERQAAEGARLAAEATALKHQEETLTSAKVAPVGRVCIVPSLRGYTLSAARRAINKTHCRLGRVSRPYRHRGALIVTGQTPRHGKKLAGQAAIAVVLGYMQSRHGRRA